YYRPAASATARSWAARVSHRPEFRFALKLWKRFTHERQSAFTREEVDAVRAGLDPIAEAGKLGAVLLQFPWSFRNDEANREWLRKEAGRDERYDSPYTAKELQPWADRTRELAEDPEVAEVYVVNNNHFRGQAAANAAMLRSQVTGGRVAVPPQLLETYREVLAPFARVS